LKSAEYMEAPMEGFDSTMGCGGHVPSDQGVVITPKGLAIPLGNVSATNEEDTYLGFNEYIVYDEKRVRIKYVVMVRLVG